MQTNKKDIEAQISHQFELLGNSAKEIFSSGFGEVVDVNSVLEKIFVDRPYFAFTSLHKKGEIWIGKVVAEQPISNESTNISSAEASRHMAILGSCALSEFTEEKKYYLAVKARMNKGSEIKDYLKSSKNGEELYVFAKKLFLDDKEGIAATIITDANGKIIFQFEVGYTIIKPKIFEKVFKKHYKDISFDPQQNPYRSLPSLSNISYLNDFALRATLHKTLPENCSGHFNRFPMWPVGAMAYICIKTVGEFLKKIIQDENAKFILHSARMDVFIPPIIDEDTNFTLFYCGSSPSEPNIHRFSWVMNSLSSGSEVYNTMFISFEIL